MLKIGIIGNPGSGKTTLSKYLENKYPNVGNLCVDTVTFNNEELQKTRNQIVWAAHNNSFSNEKLKENQLDYRNKLSVAVGEELKRIEDSGKDIVLIDYSVLYNLPELWESVQYKILVTREDEQKKKGLVIREGEMHVNLIDTFVKIACLEDDAFDKDFVIHNNSSLENLYKCADEVYNEILSKNNGVASTKHFSYYIVKPDGIRHFKEIYSSLKSLFEEMSSVYFFKIDDYSKIIKKLYYKLYEVYPDIFPETIDSLMNGLNSLYGNEGLLIVISQLHNNERDYEDFLKKIFAKKVTLRETLMDSNVLLLQKLSKTSKIQGKNILFLEGHKYRIDVPKALSKLHCPEDNKEETENELRILIESGIICAANLLGEEDIMNVMKYGSIMGFNQDSHEQKLDAEKYQRNKIVQSLLEELKKYIK